MRAAVEAAAERDDAGPARISPRDLHRVLDGLGAGREEHRLGRSGDRRDGVKPLGQPHVGFIGCDLEADMAEQLHLLLDRGDDPRMLMAGIHHGNARAEIDVALAVLAPNLGVLRALGVDRSRLAHAARHGRDSPLMKLGRRWHVLRFFLLGV